MNLLLLLMGMALINANRKADEGFRIYCFDTNAVDQALSRYEYDDSWIHFLQSADLTKASVIIDDQDIDTYNWASQEIQLTASGLKKLQELEKTNTYLSHLKFITTVDSKRLYAGELLSFMSAMAIRHPVIHYDFERTSVGMIRIYPVHSIQDLSTVSSAIRERTATSEVKSHFKRTAKLN